MDLANFIVEASAATFKAECNDKKCRVNVSMHGGRYVRDLSVIPMSNHVLIAFRTIEFKLNRQDRHSFNDTVDFLVNEVEDDILKTLREDVEIHGYWPQNDDEYNVNLVTVGRADQIVFSKEFDEKKLTNVLGTYLRNMRLVN
jgi:hypothetical protein